MSIPTIQVGRLNRLKAILGEVKETKTARQFNMDYFAKKLPTCGTSACALGWAGLDRGFRRLGLKTNIRTGEVVFEGNEDFSAAVEFFGLTYREATFLFTPITGKNSINQVIERVGLFLSMVAMGGRMVAGSEAMLHDRQFS